MSEQPVLADLQLGGPELSGRLGGEALERLAHLSTSCSHRRQEAGHETHLVGVRNRRFLRRHVAVTWSEIGGALRKSALVAACSSLFPVAAVLLKGDFNFSIPAAAAVALTAGCGWLVGAWLTQHRIWYEMLHTFEALRSDYFTRRAKAARAPG